MFKIVFLKLSIHVVVKCDAYNILVIVNLVYK